MKYCISCLNPFPEEELQDCICSNYFGKGDFKIVTKTGIKIINQKYLYCKDCLKMKHSHEGEAFI